MIYYNACDVVRTYISVMLCFVVKMPDVPITRDLPSPTPDELERQFPEFI